MWIVLAILKRHFFDWYYTHYMRSTRFKCPLTISENKSAPIQGFFLIFGLICSVFPLHWAEVTSRKSKLCRECAKWIQNINDTVYTDDITSRITSVECCKDRFQLLNKSSHSGKNYLGNRQKVLFHWENLGKIFSPSRQKKVNYDNEIFRYHMESKEKKSNTLKENIFTPSSKSRTKKNLLEAFAQNFTPICVPAPKTIQLKILLQRIWQHKSR